MESVGVVVVAAGGSSRMAGVDKIFAPLLGRPLLAYCLEQFQACPAAQEIVVVVAAASLERGRQLIQEYGFGKVSRVCAGGARRQDSARLGLEALAPCAYALVHDGARPLLDGAMLERGLAAARETGAAAAGVPVKDTIKRVTPEMLVAETPPRATLWAAQTPQIFRYELLLDAHRRCPQNVTDDAAMLESLGQPVKMFLGSYENIKVTTPEDLALAEALLRARTVDHLAPSKLVE